MACEWQLINPVGLPGEFYPIGSGYGSRVDPITGDPGWHSGIDIPAPALTPVRAALDGMVKYSGFTPSGGNTIYIDHGNGLQTRYLHMNVRLYEEGDFVRSGMQIGSVGATGDRVTGNHLHFEIRNQDKPVNPTDCYNNSATTWTNPYVVPDEYSGATVDYTTPPPASGDSFNWLPWIIGGLAVVVIGGVLYYRNHQGKLVPVKKKRKRTALARA